MIAGATCDGEPSTERLKAPELVRDRLLEPFGDDTSSRDFHVRNN